MSFSDLELNDKVLALDADLKAWPYVWTGRAYLPERKGQKLKIAGKRSGRHRIVTVEFEDGTKEVSSDAFFRRRPVR